MALMDRSAAISILGIVAGDQHGMFTRAQAINADVDPRVLTRLAREKNPRIEQVDLGVWRFLPATSFEAASLYAAWLRLDPKRAASERLADTDPAGVVSGWSAAWLYGVGDHDPEPFEFIMAERRRESRGQAIIRRRQIDRVDWHIHRTLPVLTPAATAGELMRTWGDGGHVGGALVGFLTAGLASYADIVTAAGSAYRKWGFGSPRRFVDYLLDQSGLHVPDSLRAAS